LFDNEVAEVQQIPATCYSNGKIDTCDLCVRYRNIQACLLQITYEFQSNGGQDWAVLDARTKAVSPGLKFELSDIAPEIEVVRELEEKELYIGKQMLVKTIITNKGTLTAKNLNIQEALPSHIEVVKVRHGGYLQGDTVVADPVSLRGGESITMEYFIRAAKNIDASLVAAIEFDVLGEHVKDTSDKLKIDVEDIYEVDVTYDPSSPAFPNMTTMSVVMRNKDPDNVLNLDEFFLTLPDGIHIEDSEDVEVRGGKLILQGIDIDPGDTYNWSVLLKADAAGGYSFEGSSSYTIRNAEFQKSHSAKVTWEFPYGQLSAELKFWGENMLTNDTGKMWVLVRNEDSFDYSHINLTVYSDLFGTRNYTLTDFRSGAYESIDMIEFISPNVSKTTKYKAELAGAGVSIVKNTKTGERFSPEIKATDSIDIVPPEEAIEINIAQVPKDPVQNQSATIAVDIENILDRTSIPYVFVKEAVPDWLLVGRKRLESTFFLDARQTGRAYKYEIRIPYHIETFNPNITTTVTALNVKHRIARTIPITLEEQPEIKVSVDTPRELMRGSPVEVTYTIENTGDFTVYNVDLSYIPTGGMETSEEGGQQIDHLDPEESVSGVAIMRPSRAGQVSAGAFEVFYMDKHQNVIKERIHTKNVTVAGGSSPSPLLIVEKAAEQVGEGLIEVEIKVSNIGGSPADVSLSDGYVTEEFSVDAEQKEVVSYLFNVSRSGNITLPAVEYSYLSNSITMKGLTEPLTIEVTDESEDSDDYVDSSSPGASGTPVSQHVSTSESVWSESIGSQLPLMIVGAVIAVIAIVIFVRMKKKKVMSYQ
ncbi:MAG: hypothetical protein ACOCWQ_05575, partial [Nanoarchaeota archaeon]